MEELDLRRRSLRQEGKSEIVRSPRAAVLSPGCFLWKLMPQRPNGRNKASLGSLVSPFLRAHCVGVVRVTIQGRPGSIGSSASSGLVISARLAEGGGSGDRGLPGGGFVLGAC